MMVRMPGFGLDGPWRDNPAFAYVIEAAAGISWLTGYPDQKPATSRTRSVTRTPGSTPSTRCCWRSSTDAAPARASLIEAAMVDAAINVAAEQVIEYSAYGALLGA